MSGERNQTWLTKRRVLGAMLTGAVLAAIGTRIGFQTPARRLLAVHFMALQAKPTVAFGIWRRNLRILAGLAGAMLCAQFVQSSTTVGRFERVMLRVCDATLCLWAIGTAVLAGVLIGAYGTRQIRGFLPQGPIEIAAWLALIVLYVDVRHRRVTIRPAVRRLAVIAVLLAAAALLELWAGV